MEPIGIIKTPYRQKLGIPRQASLATKSCGRIEFYRDRVGTGSLAGLSGFSHLWVIFNFHLHKSSRKAKIAAPRLAGERIGVMATRSPHRPNPIGLSLCRIVKVLEDEMVIEVAEVDMLDQTPILDVKPYLGYADRPELWQESWTAKESPPQYEVVFSATAEQQKFALAVSDDTLATVKESLAYDPRPHSQKTRHKQFATIINNYNFFFVVSGRQVTVENICPV